MAALLKSAESKDFVGSNPTLSATRIRAGEASNDHRLCPPRHHHGRAGRRRRLSHVRGDGVHLGQPAPVHGLRSGRLLRLQPEHPRDEAPHATGHPIIRSIMPGQDWMWCYLDELQFRKVDGDFIAVDPFFEAGLWFIGQHLEAWRNAGRRQRGHGGRRRLSARRLARDLSGSRPPETTFERTNGPPSNRCPAGPGDPGTAPRTVRCVPAFPRDPDGSRLAVPSVPAVDDRSPVPALSEPAGPRLRGLRADRAGTARPAERLTPAAHPAILPRHHEERAVNGTSTRRASAKRSGGWWKPERRRQGMDPGASGPNATAASAAPASRLRRRAPAIQGSADRQVE